jgi:stage 0 sporulation protein B (sporulation initiation phosphotransferase)
MLKWKRLRIGRGMAVKNLVEVLSYQRHDILNHMQVLLGYLKLGRYEQCEEYIKRFIQLAHRDSLVSALGHDELAAFLLTFNVFHKNITLEVEIPVPFSFSQMTNQTDEVCRWIISLVKAIGDHYENNQGEPGHLILRMHKEGDSLLISTDYNGLLNGKWEETFSALKEKISQWRGQLINYEFGEGELFIEWEIPF